MPYPFWCIVQNRGTNVCTWFALQHLQFPTQRFLQLHLTSSFHTVAASGKSDHRGDQSCSAALVQTHSLSEGSDGQAINTYPQICPAWYIACFVCWKSAALEGGIFCNIWLPRVNIRASLTCSAQTFDCTWGQLISPWFPLGHERGVRILVSDTLRTPHIPCHFLTNVKHCRDSITTGYCMKQEHGPCLLSPSCWEIPWAAMYRNFAPWPNAIHNSHATRILVTAIVTTYVSVAVIMMRSWPCETW